MAHSSNQGRKLLFNDEDPDIDEFLESLKTRAKEREIWKQTKNAIPEIAKFQPTKFVPVKVQKVAELEVANFDHGGGDGDEGDPDIDEFLESLKTRAKEREKPTKNAIPEMAKTLPTKPFEPVNFGVDDLAEDNFDHGGGGDVSSQRNQEAKKIWSRMFSRSRKPTPAPAIFDLDEETTEPTAGITTVINKDGHVDSVKLFNLDVIPAPYRHIFEEIQYFNFMQSKVLPSILHDPDRPSIAVCAPTGTGKTILFELAIIRLLADHADLFTGRPFSGKIIYLGPLKSLCGERFRDWNEKFRSLGLTVVEVTGDTSLEDQAICHKAHIIITTPEKWDAMTRKWKDHNLLIMKSTRLMCIDEVHLLSEPERGAALEAIVSRVKTANVAQGTVTRFIAVSATAPNIEDVAQWLGSAQLPGKYFKLEADCRPVHVTTIVHGVSYSGNNAFALDNLLDKDIPEVIRKYSENKPSLVFCMTRKSCERAAKMLASLYPLPQTQKAYLGLQNATKNLSNAELKSCILKGVAFHHAGLSYPDRRVVEELYLDNLISVLFSTTTLSQGVNLPAHLVVLKGVSRCVNGQPVEINETDILQTTGRAGRPQFQETTAYAVIMCAEKDVDKFQRLLSGQKILESLLHKNLPEHLNSEVVCQTITSVDLAIDWLKSTFYYIRCMKNRHHYGIPLNNTQAETRLKNIVHAELNNLAKYGLVLLDSEDTVKPTEVGKLMASYCISFETMQSFANIEPKTFLRDLLMLICSTKEIRQDVTVRVEEKTFLYSFHNDKSEVPRVKFPRKEQKIKSVSDKIFTLVQTDLGCFHDVEELKKYRTEMAKIMRIGCRVSKCLYEFLTLPSVAAEKGFSNIKNAFILMRSFHRGIWYDSPFVLKQLEGIGPATSSLLVKAGFTSFSNIEKEHPTRIGCAANRNTETFGLNVIKTVKSLPKYQLSLKQTQRTMEKVRGQILISITNLTEIIANTGHQTGKSRRKFGMPIGANHSATLMVANSEDKLIIKRQIYDQQFFSGKEHLVIDFTMEKEAQPPHGKLTVYLYSDYWIGLDLVKDFVVVFSPQGSDEPNIFEQISIPPIIPLEPPGMLDNEIDSNAVIEPLVENPVEADPLPFISPENNIFLTDIYPAHNVQKRKAPAKRAPTGTKPTKKAKPETYEALVAQGQASTSTSSSHSNSTLRTMNRRGINLMNSPVNSFNPLDLQLKDKPF